MMKMFSAAQLAREMKLSPKRVRSVLRKSGAVRPGGRWEFPMNEKAKLKALVRSSRQRANVAKSKGKRKASVVAKKATKRIVHEAGVTQH